MRYYVKARNLRRDGGYAFIPATEDQLFHTTVFHNTIDAPADGFFY